MRFEAKMEYLQTKQEEEKKQQVVIESWPEQEVEGSTGSFLTTEGVQVKDIPRWTEIFGGKRSAKE